MHDQEKQKQAEQEQLEIQRQEKIKQKRKEAKTELEKIYAKIKERKDTTLASQIEAINIKLEINIKWLQKHQK